MDYIKYNKIQIENVEMIRDEYIIKKYGMETYKFEKSIKFYNFPEIMFKYNTNLDEIFEINHQFISDQNNDEIQITYL